MFTVRSLPEFTAWLKGLTDTKSRDIVAARIDRMKRGLFGDVKPVGEGISELRIDFGAGWRVYFTQREKTLIVLLVGGSERTQDNDIKRAKELAKALKENKA